MKLSDLNFADHSDKWNEIRITNPDAPGSVRVFTKGRNDGFDAFVATLIEKYNNPSIECVLGRVTVLSDQFQQDVNRQNKACQNWCDQNITE